MSMVPNLKHTSNIEIFINYLKHYKIILPTFGCKIFRRYQQKIFCSIDRRHLFDKISKIKSRIRPRFRKT